MEVIREGFESLGARVYHERLCYDLVAYLPWPRGYCNFRDMTERTNRFTSFRSVRAYRTFLNEMANDCQAGRRPMADLTRAAAFAKVGTELFLAEVALAKAGADREPDNHPMGDDGGLNLSRPGVYVERSITEEEGTSAKGTPTDNRKVTTIGPAHDNEVDEW